MREKHSSSWWSRVETPVLFKVRARQIAPSDDRRGADYAQILSSVSQGMVDQHDRKHGFRYGCCTQSHAGIVTTFRDHGNRLPLFIDRLASLADAGSGFKRNVCHNILTG